MTKTSTWELRMPLLAGAAALAMLFLLAGCLSGLQAGGSSDIWIAHRGGGPCGSGTEDDPYDASTEARFDGILGRLWSEGRKNIIVHIGLGTYETVGNGGYIAGLQDLGQGWRCRSGWKMEGSGQEKTVLKLLKIYKYQGLWGNAVVTTTDSSVSNVVVQDLTVDCNHSAIGNQKSTENGISLGGTHHTIRRVTVRNLAGRGYEGFPISISACSVNSSNNLIEDCTITGWHGGTGGSITICNNVNNLKPPFTFISGIVRRNHVIGTYAGYGGWGMRGVVFEDNIAEGCAYGSNIDSIRNPLVTFADNRFIGCRNYGMVFANCSNVTIRDNIVNLSASGPAIFLLNNCANFTITGNTFGATHPGMAIDTVDTRDKSSMTGYFNYSGNSSPPSSGVHLPVSSATGNKQH